MKRATETALKASLTKVIAEWIDSGAAADAATQAGDVDLPWLGEEIAEIMAEAALSVLRGIADAQAYLERENMLKEDGDE